MKSCQVWGSMSADRIDDIYPTVSVCNECVESIMSESEQEKIVSILSDEAFTEYDECHFCGKSQDEEFEEMNGCTKESLLNEKEELEERLEEINRILD